MGRLGLPEGVAGGAIAHQSAGEAAITTSGRPTTKLKGLARQTTGIGRG